MRPTSWGGEHEKYVTILLQASEILQNAHHELFWNESLFAEPFIEARARRRNSVKAAEKRHENTELMRRNALKLRDAGKWSSRRQAAKAIVPEVQLHAKELGARVSADRIEQTVYEWFTKEDKKRASAC